MKSYKNYPLLYAVTDRKGAPLEAFLGDVESSLRGGITCLQLREKTATEEEFLAIGRAVKALCEDYKVPFIINDNIAVAQALDGDGLHIGQSDGSVRKAREAIGPHKILGVSADTVESAIEAEKEGADYIGCGAIFPTQSKGDATLVTMDTLKAIKKAVSIPVVAIGGITYENLLSLKGTAIDGVALISAIYGSPSIEEGTRALLERTRVVLGKKATALTIAGSDSSGGAGIQADIKAMTMNDVYAMSAITALTAQNTQGVISIQEATADFLCDQLKTIFEDIYPDAVKIGMVSSVSLIKEIVAALRRYEATNIVVDPVMVATSGAKLISDEAIQVLKEELLPLAMVITPNISEAEILLQRSIQTSQDMEEGARQISETYGCAVLLKGGHCISDANDYLYHCGQGQWFKGQRIHNPNTHGTGCTLSSAMAAFLARGYTLSDAIQRAKDYISGALEAQLNLGRGSGPMDHAFLLENKPENKNKKNNNKKNKKK